MEQEPFMQKSVLPAPFFFLHVVVQGSVLFKVINFPLSLRVLSYADIQNKMPTISVCASLPPVAFFLLQQLACHPHPPPEETSLIQYKMHMSIFMQAFSAQAMQ